MRRARQGCRQESASRGDLKQLDSEAARLPTTSPSSQPTHLLSCEPDARMDRRSTLAPFVIPSSINVNPTPGSSGAAEAFDGRTDFQREQERLVAEIANVRPAQAGKDA